jgi:hypothetical protein
VYEAPGVSCQAEDRDFALRAGIQRMIDKPEETT